MSDGRDGRNLWIGALLGMLLTGGLMFALYQQSGLAGAERQAVEKTAFVKPDASAVFVPVETAVTRPETPVQPEQGVELSAADAVSVTANASVAATEPTPALVSLDNDSTSPADSGVLGKESVPVAAGNALPEAPELSPAELGEMSLAEREQYEKMLQSYREVRAQVLQLDRERAELKQRMNSMFERNDAMERKIERMRASLQQLPEKTD